MPPKTASEGEQEKQRDHAEDPPTSPPQAQDAAQFQNADQQTPQGPSDDAETRPVPSSTPENPQTPTQTSTSDRDGPFDAPNHNGDPFVIRLRPDMVRNEENFLAAITDTIHNEQRVRTFMRLALTPAEATAVRDRQAAQVLSELTDENLTLQDALWYLEYVGWDVELAILQQIHDSIDRTEAPGPDSVQVEADFPAENLKLDRGPALAGKDFDEAKFKVKFVQYGVERTRTYPEWLSLDRNDIDQVRALNRWRWKTIMAQVGLNPASKRKGSKYHPLERLWLRNYEQRNPNSTGREITEDFNATFEGRMLPGETQPRPHRSLAAIACVRLRRDGRKRKKEEEEEGDDQ